MARIVDPLPPVTDEHRRAAFALFRWPGVTFEQAMAVDIRRKLIEAAAHVERTRQHRKARSQQPYRTPRWNADALLGPLPRLPQHHPAADLKRLAAHDLDD